MFKKKFRLSDNTSFELCHKKAWSLWLCAGMKRYFITCNIRDMSVILGYDTCEFRKSLVDYLRSDNEDDFNIDEEEMRF